MWSRAYPLMDRVTTGLGGVKRRFKGAQRSSSHILLLAAKYKNFKGLSKTYIFVQWRERRAQPPDIRTNDSANTRYVFFQLAATQKSWECTSVVPTSILGDHYTAQGRSKYIFLQTLIVSNSMKSIHRKFQQLHPLVFNGIYLRYLHQTTRQIQTNRMNTKRDIILNTG